MTLAAGASGEPVRSGTLDPSYCPLCGQANRCVMEVEKQTGLAQPPCWCTTATFSPELLARIDPARRDLACVCAKCAALGRQGSAGG